MKLTRKLTIIASIALAMLISTALCEYIRGSIVSAATGDVIYVSDAGSGKKDGSSPNNAVSGMSNAIKKLADRGGTIVVSAPVTVNSFSEPDHSAAITITSVYGGVDYRKTASATFNLQGSYTQSGAVTFDDITVCTSGATRIFFGNGHPLVFGDGVVCEIDGSGGSAYPYVFGGTNKKSGTLAGASVTVAGGRFHKVSGGNRYVGGIVEGDISVTISGGIVDTYVCGAGAGVMDGNVSVTADGGFVKYGLYGIDSTPDRSATVNGTVTVRVNGGDLGGNIAAARHDRYATHNGAFELYVNTDELDLVAQLRGNEKVAGTNTSKIIYSVDAAKKMSGEVTYTNPEISGADPWVIYHDGYYYMAVTRGSSITIAKATTVAGLGRADPVCVWTATTSTGVDDSLWSPELHYFSEEEFGEDAGWYLYIACPPVDHPGDNFYRRCYVLRALSDDPQGNWGSPDGIPDVPMQIKMDEDNTHWNIGPSVFRIDGKIYMTWTGRVFEYYGVHTQNLNIALMTTPYTLDLSTHAIICEPTEAWEKHGSTHSPSKEKNMPEVVEGATAVYGDNGEVWCIYSASGYWNENYALAQLRYTGGDPCDINNWEKCESPIFVHNTEVYGPGHASYTMGHDGTRYFVYHGYLKPKNEGSRYIFVEEYTIEGNDVILGNGTPRALSTVASVKNAELSLLDRTLGFDESESNGSILLGDVNCDGILSNDDVTLLVRVLAGIDVEYLPDRADMDGNGRLNNRDAIFLIRRIAG